MRPRVTLQLPPQTVSTSRTGGVSALDGASVLLLGFGYVARATAPALIAAGASVTHTSRSGDGIAFGSQAMRDAFETADIVISSIPPAKDGTDPALTALCGVSTRARWIGYLSATSVYGDRAGQWAFEGEAPTPGIERGVARATAELHWLEAYPVTQIFRLAGIYGPGRAPFKRIKSGTARIIDAPDHVVNRIYVDDIVDALIASIHSPSPHDIFNLADGHPAPPGDVMAYAAQLIHAATPPTVPLSDPSVSAMARSFYAETKRIDITHAKTRLGWEPRFKTYKEGLKAVLETEG